MQHAGVEGQEIVSRDEDERSLIEAPFHGVVKLLTENARGIESIRAAVRGT